MSHRECCAAAAQESRRLDCRAGPCEQPRSAWTQWRCGKASLQSKQLEARRHHHHPAHRRRLTRRCCQHTAATPPARRCHSACAALWNLAGPSTTPPQVCRESVDGCGAAQPPTQQRPPAGPAPPRPLRPQPQRLPAPHCSGHCCLPQGSCCWPQHRPRGRMPAARSKHHSRWRNRRTPHPAGCWCRLRH